MRAVKLDHYDYHHKFTALARRDQLRQQLPPPGRMTSTEDLHKALQIALEVDELCLRTTQRDLAWLAKQGYASRFEVQGKKNAYWSAAGQLITLKLSPNDAMHLHMIFTHAERFGMTEQVKHLRLLREYAGEVMRLKRDIAWSRRVTSATRFTLLRPAEIRPGILERIQQALFDNKALRVTYRPREADGHLCDYYLKPLALSYQDSNIYLSCLVSREKWHGGYMPDPDKPRGKHGSNGPNELCALTLHRIEAVDDCVDIIPDPADYDVNSQAARKDLFTLYSLEPVALKLRIRDQLYIRLSENPLCDNQVIEPAGNEWWNLTCAIQDSQGLRLFLLANADCIEVVAPSDLRAHVRNSLQAAVALYVDE
ncbi:WYL domain-containing protein [Pseudomonas luteola]|uniref:helix-turn-helix transcriptional regulator n=1 Tax=Pseudomonas luteola TaxID=47886 RepID=UPI001FCBC04A|nr:WYL domain-containing protein [Pseudomonas luteola]